MRKLKGVWLNVATEEAKVIEINDDLDEFYRTLHCDTIDIVRRRIGRKHFNIICDDEGLLKYNPKISAVDETGKIMLVGNLFIVSGEDNEGELLSLTNEEIEYIMKRVHRVYTNNYPNGYPMLTECGY